MKLYTRICYASLCLATVALADPVAMKARVEEPALQETMGGCSLKCAFAWSVEVLAAGGQKAATAKKLNDENAETAWLADAGTTGVGAKLRLVFPKKLKPEMEGNTPVYGLDIINGIWASEQQWKIAARVKRARVYYRDKPIADVTFADSRRWQRVLFPDVFVRSGDSMTFEILETYPGEKGTPVALTEIVLQGAH
ncbi:MAG: hypothetical protein K8R23_07525 [Chthoniobacter sp.]|nr:hypothetical protein [Chthoniobacter sp.]